MMLSQRDEETIRDRLKVLAGPVKVVNFTRELECEFCWETRKLLERVAALSENVWLEVHSFQLDKDVVGRYRIDKIPATVIEGKKDYGIRFYGLPFGYEFAVLLEDLVGVSRGESGLTPETTRKLREVQQPVHLQVFVTPTCPYCPQASRLAHQFAMEGGLVTADVIEAAEFPHLVERYGVRGVPFTVVNEQASIVGALSEEAFLEEMTGVLQDIHPHHVATPARM